MRRSLAAALAVASVVVLAPQAQAAPRAVEWAPCADTPTLLCTTLTVPLDYRNPGGERIELAISKLPSTKPAQRRGVLLLNPGGPGGSGLGMPAGLAAAGLPVSVLDTYDLIGFDPRGVGQSSPVTCDLRPDQIASNVPPYAKDAADVAARAEFARTVAKQCAESSSGARLSFISTANTARDMDLIREALGEPKISYFGGSYGSYLGAVYATLFPERTDRIVLDSVTGPGGLDPAGARLMGQGMEDRFPDFARWAADRDGTYELGRNPRQVKAKYFELAAKLDANPVAGITGALFRHYTFGSLYGDANFPVLAQQWQALDRAEAPVAVQAAQDVTNLLSSQLYVVCGDADWPEDVGTYQRNVEQDRKRYPMFGAASANIWPCAFWGTEPAEPPVAITDDGPSTVLLVQNRRDPATPLAGAREMRRALGDRARMVTVDQGGHGTYLSENACANNAVTRFLVDGTRPARDVSCGADRSAFGTLSDEQRRARERAFAEVHPGLG
ncbi:alpha/beta hydrolase [Amycolatopsis sp. 195334CR]|uniref:alpha/beta hydrolase n=1 Tax=Amycolatopsis sp. 195334CR TaxID=2814588 RepID=UPI001A8F206F|nr:alpha/beta hydrolase [Amycolatopsis sp. 195334CR]MBN6039266.1 alpha/beta fold hydrolase [Amycolatopsis sp. 195334CR]